MPWSSAFIHKPWSSAVIDHLGDEDDYHILEDNAGPCKDGDEAVDKQGGGKGKMKKKKKKKKKKKSGSTVDPV